MRATVAILVVVVNFAIVGCANAVSPPREAYILAREHGWLDITVSDPDVPAAPPTDDQKDYRIQPPSCRLSVYLNEERFLSEAISPVGDQPPYRVETGFRFAAPVGQAALRIEYFGCDVVEGKGSGVSDSTLVEIRQDLVVPIIFDGLSMFVEGLREDEAVTLEKLDTRLDRIERLLETK